MPSVLQEIIIKVEDSLGRIFCDFLKLLGDNFINKHLIKRGGIVIDEIETPGKNPTGLALENRECLWHCDAWSRMIYKIEINTGKVKKVFKAPGPHPWGLAYDGCSLWNSDDYTCTIYQIDADKGYLIKKFKYPNTDLHGLAYDGKYILAVDRKNTVIIWLNPKDGTIVKRFPIPSSDPITESGGLEIMGKYLWLSNGTKASICLLDPSGGRTLKEIQLMKCHPHDLAFHEDHLYVSIRNLRRIYKIRIEGIRGK